MTASLALCMIVRDEEERLERALASARGGFDELIVLDAGSLDHSEYVARQWGAHVIVWPRAPVFDFAAARNATLSSCTADYWWFMDADEVACDGTSDRLRAQVATRPAHAVLGVTRDRWTRHLRVRLAPRNAEHRWVGACHEWLTTPFGVVSDEGIVFDHLPREDRGASSLLRNLAILASEIANGRGTQRDYFYVALTLQSLGLHAEAAQAWEVFLVGGNVTGDTLAFAQLYLARAYDTLGDSLSAAEHATFALKLKDQFAEAACLLGDIARTVGDRILAACCYSRALESGSCPIGPLFHEPDAYGPYPERQLVALANL
jgi:glycosyltransferase involved in cell wall biosynthesis